MQEIESKSERTVFANKRSVSQKEFFEAGISGLKAQYVFDIRLLEYNNERELIHNNTTYSIYRMYEKGENIELYCEVRTGND